MEQDNNNESLMIDQKKKSNIAHKFLYSLVKAGQLWRKIIRVPYVAVPECPACGSRKTGRFITNHKIYDCDWLINNSLKNGELIDFLDTIDPENALFCVDCGYTWTQPIIEKWITLKELDEEKSSRGVYSLLQERQSDKLNTERRERHCGITGFLHDTFDP